jgi:predicted dinucleotide-binding enzyme
MTTDGMRIAIIGTGGIGGPYGASLARAGADVTFVARDHCDEVEGRHNKDLLATLPPRFDPIDPFARYE